MPSSPEPRRDFPVPVRVEITLPDGAIRSEYAVNISPGGLCLHVADLLPTQVDLAVRFELPPEASPVRVSAHVVWTSWHEGTEESERFWETGLRFAGLDPAASQHIHDYASHPKNRRR